MARAALVALAAAARASAPHTEAGWGMFRGGPYRDGATLNWGPTANGTAWRFLLRGKALAAPSVHPDGSMIYVGGHDGFYGVHADGTFGFFKKVLRGVVNSAAAISLMHPNSLAIFGGQDGVVYALDARSGVEKWRLQTGMQQKGGGSAYVYSSPVLDDRGVAYVGAADGYLYALAVDPAAPERVLWKFDARGEPIWSSPALSADQKTVYVGGVDNFVHAVDAATGKKVWEFEAGGFPDDPDDPDVDSSPAVSRTDGTVYVGSFDNRLHALDGKTGHAKWSYATRDDIISSPTVSRDGKRVYVGSESGVVHCVETSEGARVWTKDLGAAIYDEAVLDGRGVLYVGADDGKLYALDAATGRTLWVHDVGDKVRGEPAIANGRLYVSTINDDDFLHAIGGEAPPAAPPKHKGSGGGSSSSDDGPSAGRVIGIIALVLGLVVFAGVAVKIGLPIYQNHVAAHASAQRWSRMTSSDEPAPDNAAPFVELQTPMANSEVI